MRLSVIISLILVVTAYQGNSQTVDETAIVQDEPKFQLILQGQKQLTPGLYSPENDSKGSSTFITDQVTLNVAPIPTLKDKVVSNMPRVSGLEFDMHKPVPIPNPYKKPGLILYPNSIKIYPDSLLNDK